MNCWDCAKMLKGGVYFPGRCDGFTHKVLGKLPAKEIPLSLVDGGCLYWKERTKDNDEIIPLQRDDYQGGE